MSAVTLIRTDQLSVAPLSERVIIVALVLVLHVAVVLGWLVQPERASVAVSEMSVSVAIRQAEVAQPQAQPSAQPFPRVEPVEKITLKQQVQEVSEALPQAVTEPMLDESASDQSAMTPPAVATAPVHDTSPDYRASYLNNPRPAYPMVARRRGWEGRVVLNVEVLAEGGCGAASVFQSSGHQVLDNAALRTVQDWRFVPASRAGHPVTQWFKVPIQFSLKGNEV